MANPLVSVLLPSLNMRPFLDARVESLLAQTHVNWEAIVLDSGSSDGSWEFFQSIAATDPRFQLHQIPKDGVYAALNCGVQLVTGEFLCVATCDDTMAPDFLGELLNAFRQCPEAGIAVCDARLIDRHGIDLSAEEVTGHLPERAIAELLESGAVRSAFSEGCSNNNYRPAPHDCFLHFDGRSVYFSLTQVVVRTVLAKAAVPFETNVGSIADFGWFLRLTNLTGTVHVPKKLASWRFHGNQLSIQRDDSRLASMKAMYERALPEIYQHHRYLFSSNDCAALLLPCQVSLANSFAKRAAWRLEAIFRLVLMFVQKPVATLRAIRAVHFRIGTLQRSLVPMVLQRAGLAPKELSAASDCSDRT